MATPHNKGACSHKQLMISCTATMSCTVTFSQAVSHHGSACCQHLTFCHYLVLCQCLVLCHCLTLCLCDCLVLRCHSTRCITCCHCMALCITRCITRCHSPRRSRAVECTTIHSAAPTCKPDTGSTAAAAIQYQFPASTQPLRRRWPSRRSRTAHLSTWHQGKIANCET